MNRTSWTVLGCSAALFGVAGLAGLAGVGCGGVDTGGLFGAGATGAGGSTSASGPVGSGETTTSTSGAGEGSASVASSGASGSGAVCGNGVVEAGEACDDGNVASNDGCSSACQVEGATCASAVALSVAPGTMTVKGSTKGGGKHSSSGCKASAGPDRVYTLTAQTDGFLTVSLSRTSTSFNSVLYITQACADNGDNAPFLCADSDDPDNPGKLFGGEVVSLRVKAGNTFDVFVDGAGPADEGDYTMVIDLSSGLDCNDPVPIPLEPGSPMRVLGSNTNIQPGVQGSCGGMPGGQVVYAITRSDDGDIDVETVANVTNYNTVLYARDVCDDDGSEIDCDNADNTDPESISIWGATAGKAIYVWVDGSTAGGGSPSGNYALTIAAP